MKSSVTVGQTEINTTMFIIDDLEAVTINGYLSEVCSVKNIFSILKI